MKDLWHKLPIAINRRVQQTTGSRHKGATTSVDGMRLKGAREYEIGDSPRSVSFWDIAKFDQEIVWEHYPDRSALVVILFDVSASEYIGSDRTKHSASIELAHGFARACLYKNDLVILIAFTDKIEFESKVIASVNSLGQAIDEIAGLVPKEKKTDPKSAVERAIDLATRTEKQADMVCLVSDLLFEDVRFNDFSALCDCADVIAYVVRDRIEYDQTAFAGAMMVRDAETGDAFYASGSGENNPVTQLEKAGVEVCILETADTEENYFYKLKEFFTLRQKQGSRTNHPKTMQK